MKSTKVLMEIRSRTKQLEQIRFYLYLTNTDHQSTKRLVKKYECLTKELQKLKSDMLTATVLQKFRQHQ